MQQQSKKHASKIFATLTPKTQNKAQMKRKQSAKKATQSPMQTAMTKYNKEQSETTNTEATKSKQHYEMKAMQAQIKIHPKLLRKVEQCTIANKPKQNTPKQKDKEVTSKTMKKQKTKLQTKQKLCWRQQYRSNKTKAPMPKAML